MFNLQLVAFFCILEKKTKRKMGFFLHLYTSLNIELSFIKNKATSAKIKGEKTTQQLVSLSFLIFLHSG